MARGYTTRKIEVWSLHAHVGSSQDENVNYIELFDLLAATPSEARVYSDADKSIAVSGLDVRGDTVWLTVYAGTRGLNPLIFNTLSAEERVQRLAAGEIVATKTHGVVSLPRREAIIEYNHQGAKAADIARALEATGRGQGWDDLKVELNPVVSTSFIDELQRFERIRLASASLVRPNIGWSDFEDSLTDAAGDSDAQAVEVEFTAPRGESLSRTHGVVPFIRRLSSARRSPLKGAAFTGRRRGEAEETTVTTSNHTEHQRINVRLTPDGHVDDDDIDRHLAEFEDARAREDNV